MGKHTYYNYTVIVIACLPGSYDIQILNKSRLPTRVLSQEIDFNSKPIGASLPLPAILFNALAVAWFIPTPIGVSRVHRSLLKRRDHVVRN